jgi:choline dehydrogenase-like flavoprotein
MMQISETDVLIIGSGLIGAAVARLVRRAEPAATILMVDAGPVIGDVAGLHLHGAPQDGSWQRYGRELQRNVIKEPEPKAFLPRALAPKAGMHFLAEFGLVADQMPGAALSWNTGGMGVHWGAITPAPRGHEIPDCVPADLWFADLAIAESILRVHPDPFGDFRITRLLKRRINDMHAGLSMSAEPIRPVPMALIPAPDNRLRRVGPNVIFPAMSDRSDPRFVLLPSVQVMRIDHDGRTVAGAQLRATESGSDWVVRARATVVCAGAFRSPQLLYASGIRPAALGKFINEHAFLDSRVIVNSALLGFSLEDLPAARDGEWCLGVHWLPHSGESQPIHGLYTDMLISDSDGIASGYAVNFTSYVPTEIKEANKLEFSDQELDATGMPRIRVKFAYSPRDLDLVEQARVLQFRTAARLGAFDPAVTPELMPAGSSLHITGTVRMGPENDGSSVCDPNMRVWNYDNLFIAGCGAIPTSMVSNATLTGTVTAVRAARAVAGLLTR